MHKDVKPLKAYKFAPKTSAVATGIKRSKSAMFQLAILRINKAFALQEMRYLHIWHTKMAVIIWALVVV
jgi:hypothetical protein